MKALFLVTHTPDCDKIWRSWQALGHECVVQQYDDRPHDRHGELVDLAVRVRPDVMVFVGAIEQYHGRPVPTADVLCRLRMVAPTVHVCSDASEHAWWEHLDAYDRQDCFSAQVNIDGNEQTPIATYHNGLIKLTPTDPAIFKPRAWNERHVPVGMPGSKGHGERAELLQRLWFRLTWRDSTSTYDDMADFICDCRVIVNSPANGSGTGDHVKGRVVEAGFGGACLLERANAVTARWFTPGVDYFEYADKEDALKQLDWAKEHDDEVAAMAARLRERMLREHHPRFFWADVLRAAGVAC